MDELDVQEIELAIEMKRLVHLLEEGGREADVMESDGERVEVKRESEGHWPKRGGAGEEEREEIEITKVFQWFEE